MLSISLHQHQHFYWLENCSNLADSCFLRQKVAFFEALRCFKIPGCGLLITREKIFDTSRWAKTTHCDCPSLVEEGGDSRGTRLDEVFFSFWVVLQVVWKSWVLWKIPNFRGFLAAKNQVRVVVFTDLMSYVSWKLVVKWLKLRMVLEGGHFLLNDGRSKRNWATRAFGKVFFVHITSVSSLRIYNYNLPWSVFRWGWEIPNPWNKPTCLFFSHPKSRWPQKNAWHQLPPEQHQ